MGAELHALPNVECDKIQAALDELLRMMPRMAPIAKAMQDAFVEAGFDKDDALKLVAYAVFK